MKRNSRGYGSRERSQIARVAIVLPAVEGKLDAGVEEGRRNAWPRLAAAPSARAGRAAGPTVEENSLRAVRPWPVGLQESRYLPAVTAQQMNRMLLVGAVGELLLLSLPGRCRPQTSQWRCLRSVLVAASNSFLQWLLGRDDAWLMGAKDMSVATLRLGKRSRCPGRGADEFAASARCRSRTTEND